jgi:hypothetical protein
MSPEPAAPPPSAAEPAPAPTPVLPPTRSEPTPPAPPSIPAAEPAPEPAPRHRLMYSNTLVLRVNPARPREPLLADLPPAPVDPHRQAVGRHVLRPRVHPDRLALDLPPRSDGDPRPADDPAVPRRLLLHRLLRQPGLQGPPVRLAERELRPGRDQGARRHEAGDQHLRRPGRARRPLAIKIRPDRHPRRGHFLSQHHQAAEPERRLLRPAPRHPRAGARGGSSPTTPTSSTSTPSTASTSASARPTIISSTRPPPTPTASRRTTTSATPPASAR